MSRSPSRRPVAWSRPVSFWRLPLGSLTVAGIKDARRRAVPTSSNSELHGSRRLQPWYFRAQRLEPTALKRTTSWCRCPRVDADDAATPNLRMPERACPREAPAGRPTDPRPRTHMSRPLPARVLPGGRRARTGWSGSRSVESVPDRPLARTTGASDRAARRDSSMNRDGSLD